MSGDFKDLSKEIFGEHDDDKDEEYDDEYKKEEDDDEEDDEENEVVLKPKAKIATPKRKEVLVNHENMKYKDQDKGGEAFRPDHYLQWELEPFTWLMINQVPFPEGKAITYLMRWRKKNGIRDLEKAKRIIEMMIEMEQSREDFLPKRKHL